MGTNCDLLEQLKRQEALLNKLSEPYGGIAIAVLLREARQRIVMLERIVDKYGDKARMAWCPDAEMQFVIDVAMENQAGRRPAIGEK